MEKICETSKCTGCSLCADVCKHGAISMQEDGNGFIVPVIDQYKCINCGLCKKFCPISSPERVQRNNVRDLNVYEAWAASDDIRMKSSSGGVFGQLAYGVLKERGVALGAAFDGLKAYHTAVIDVSDLPHIQDTKYVQSYVSGAYISTYKFLKDGKRVVFSGTPCQIAACKSYLYKKVYSGDLLTVEVVCHGVPSYLALKQSLKYVGACRVKSFRNKMQGWGYHSQCMAYQLPDGGEIHKRRDEDLFYRMFFGKKMLRPSCYSCPFACIPRVADITIGDSWGSTNGDKEEIFKGLSLILINNDKGRLWLENNGNIKFRNTSWLQSLYINRNIYTPFPPVSMVDRITEIGKWISKLDMKEYMDHNPLGLVEIRKKDNFLFKKMRNINLMIRKRFLDIYKSSDMSYVRYVFLIASYRIDSWLNPKPSECYLDMKFMDVLQQIHKSKI